jgi:hypothetical protein
MEERTKRLRSGWKDQAHDLEAQALAQNAKHVDWTCTTERMRLTSGGKGLYMHCLPADVTGLSCERGEVDREVFDHARMSTYKQASHKPFVIAALILGMRTHNPAAAISRMFQAGEASFASRKARPPTIPPPSSRRF